jgi:hypothetical protein
MNNNKESDNNLGINKPLSVISTLNNNYISPKFLTPIARKPLNSIGDFPFAHSPLGNTVEMGIDTESISLIDNVETNNEIPVNNEVATPIQRQVETNNEIPVNNEVATPIQRQLETNNEIP